MYIKSNIGQNTIMNMPSIDNLAQIVEPTKHIELQISRPSPLDCKKRILAPEQRSTPCIECDSKLEHVCEIAPAAKLPILASEDSKELEPQDMTLSSVVIEQTSSPILEASASDVQPLLLTDLSNDVAKTLPYCVIDNQARIVNQEKNLPHLGHIVTKCTRSHSKKLKLIQSSLSCLHTYMNDQRQIFHLLRRMGDNQEPLLAPQVSPYDDPYNTMNT